MIHSRHLSWYIGVILLCISNLSALEVPLKRLKPKYTVAKLCNPLLHGWNKFSSQCQKFCISTDIHMVDGPFPQIKVQWPALKNSDKTLNLYGIKTWLSSKLLFVKASGGQTLASEGAICEIQSSELSNDVKAFWGQGESFAGHCVEEGSWETMSGSYSKEIPKKCTPNEEESKVAFW